MPDTIRAFELQPRPGSVLERPVYVVLLVDYHGYPEFGENQLAPIFSSAEGAEICTALCSEGSDSPDVSNLDSLDVEDIERFTSEGGQGLAGFLDWRRVHA